MRLLNGLARQSISLVMRGGRRSGSYPAGTGSLEDTFQFSWGSLRIAGKNTSTSIAEVLQIAEQHAESGTFFELDSNFEDFAPNSTF